MGLFGFGRKEQEEWVAAKRSGAAAGDAAAQTAPGTQIRYDAGLIERFTGQHGALVDLAGKIRAGAGARDFVDTAKYVRKFKVLLNEHLLEENLRLYTYLSHCVAGNEEGRELISEMRKEMGAIGRQVSRFIHHYEEHGVDERNVDKFLTELDEMIAVLADRIEREERSLYTMYLPPSQVRELS